MTLKLLEKCVYMAGTLTSQLDWPRRKLPIPSGGGLGDSRCVCAICEIHEARYKILVRFLADKYLKAHLTFMGTRFETIKQTNLGQLSGEDSASGHYPESGSTEQLLSRQANKSFVFYQSCGCRGHHFNLHLHNQRVGQPFQHFSSWTVKSTFALVTPQKYPRSK